MRARVVFLDGVMILLWIFLNFFHLGIWGYNILFISLGVVFGSVFGVAVGLIQTGILEKKGKIRVNLLTIAFILGSFFISLGIALYLLFTLGLGAGIQMLSLLYPSVPAIYAGRMILYLNWERKHRRLILYDGLVTTRVYAREDLKGE